MVQVIQNSVDLQKYYVVQKAQLRNRMHAGDEANSDGFFLTLNPRIDSIRSTKARLFCGLYKYLHARFSSELCLLA